MCNVGTASLYFDKFRKIYDTILYLPLNCPRVPKWHLLDSLLNSKTTMKTNACIAHVKLDPRLFTEPFITQKLL